MKKTRFTLPVMAFALAGSVCTATYAGSAATADQVLASFGRLLDHAPSSTVPIVPALAAIEADPLRRAISEVLWATPSFHLPMTTHYARLDSQPMPKN